MPSAIDGVPGAARELQWRRVVITVACVVVLLSAIRAVSRPHDGDFKLHWEFGRRLNAGEFLYAGGHHIPYPPFWAAAHSPLALLPMPVAKALLFPVGVGALALLIWTLRRLMPNEQAFWAAAAALLLASRFVVRDFAELGVNTALVALTWLSIYLWSRGRDVAGAVPLGLAIALKCTPAIVAAFFLWKRQWRIGFAAGVVALLFTLAPILWQGSATYHEHMRTWIANAWSGFGGSDPSRGVLGPEPLQNMSLRPTLARYLMHLPEGHPGRASHPLYFDFFDFPPAVAGAVVKVLLGALVAAVLWVSREPVHSRRDPRVLWEFAAVSLLMLLGSPITWGQHSVAVLPACYFIAVRLLQQVPFARWMQVLLAFYVVFVLVLNRGIVGREVSLLLTSYHFETFSILALLLVVLGCRRAEAATAA
jgi:alpha-1,2-mannosyltransferase